MEDCDLGSRPSTLEAQNSKSQVVQTILFHVHAVHEDKASLLDQTNKPTCYVKVDAQLMHRQLGPLLRLTKPAALRVTTGRYTSTETRQKRRRTTDDDDDFRPPWVYSGSRFLTYTAIPRKPILSPFTKPSAHSTSSHAPLLCFPRRLGGARAYLYASKLPNRLISPIYTLCYSCADGCQSTRNRSSPYLLRKRLSFGGTKNARLAAHHHKISARMIQCHLSGPCLTHTLWAAACIYR